jgi:hypothetical protein
MTTMRPEPTPAQIAALQALTQHVVRMASAETLGLPADANDPESTVWVEPTCPGGALVAHALWERPDGSTATTSGFVLGHDPIDDLDAFLQARSRLQAIARNT